MSNKSTPTEPKPENFTSYNDYYGNWQTWFNTMKGMGLL